MQKRVGKICLAILVCVFVAVLSVLFLSSVGVEKAEAAVLAANKTEILFDGEEIEGLKGFTYKVYKDRQDVRGIGMNERIGVTYAEAQPDEEGELVLTTYGLPLRGVVGMMLLPEPKGLARGRLHVKGKILVACPEEVMDALDPTEGFIDQAEEAARLTSLVLSGHMDNNTSFQIILSIMQNSYPEGLGIKQFTFDGCHVDDREFQIDSHGYALTTYTFTADRLREE